MAASIKKKPTGESKPSSDLQSRPLGETDDDAKLIFGTVYSLRNMVKKLGGEDDRYGFHPLSRIETDSLPAFYPTGLLSTSYITTKPQRASSSSC